MLSVHYYNKVRSNDAQEVERNSGEQDAALIVAGNQVMRTKKRN